MHLRLRVHNELYPLRIIGLNQDKKASGGMAGLTFMFGTSLMDTTWEPQNSGSYANSNIFEFLNGDALMKMADSVTSNIEEVTKSTGYRTEVEAGYEANGFLQNSNVSWLSSSEILFLPSLLEVLPQQPAFIEKDYALGESGTEIYLAMENRTNLNDINSCWLRDTCCRAASGSYLRGIFNLSGKKCQLSYGSHGVNPAFCF